MGQNNLESIDQRLPHLQNWIPHDSQTNIFVNKVTHQQVQRHSLKIPAKDISRENALLTARMNCHQIYICRLFYFHPAGAEQKGGQYSDREMLVYTDKMQPVKDWSRQRIKYIITGLKRLVAAYGPFRVCESNIRENQRREIRIWISENPAKNHPDLVYKNEESIVSDLTVLLSQKNQEISSLIIGSRTLKQAFQRFQQGNRQIDSPLLKNHKRTMNSEDIHILKPSQDDKAAKSYRNGFGVMNSIKEKNQHSHTPNVRKLSNYPNSTLANKQPESKLGNSSKYSDCLPPSSNLLTVPMKGQNGNRFSSSRCKEGPQSGLEYKKSFGQDKANKNKIHQVKTETIYNSLKKQQLFRNTESSFMNSSLKADSKFVVHHRFQTMQNLTQSKNYQQTSNKPVKITHSWNSNDQPPISGCENKQQITHSSNIRCGDITIINNNVNNYVTNIIHNHIGADKKNKDNTQQCKVPPRPKPKEANNNQTIHKEKEKNRNIPFFIQQKTKVNSHRTGGSPDSNKAQSINENKVKRKCTANSNSQEPFQDFHEFGQPEGQGVKFITKESQRKNQMQNNGPKSKDHSFSPPKYSPNLVSPYPKKNNPSLTPNPQNNSFHKNNDSFEIKNTGRTKAVQYYQKAEISKSRDSSPNKRLSNNQLQQRQSSNRKQASKSIYEIKQSPSIMEESAEYLINSPQLLKNKKINQEPQSQTKVDFKKQLKQEFKCLLGNDAPSEKQQYIKIFDLIPIVQAQQITKQSDQCKQVDVRQKIKKKQLVFAELKKQALKVLTGD